MLLSILVPVYNVESYIPRCIDSLLNQLYTDYEIILVDDGSTDKSGEICDAYAMDDNRIKVIHQNNTGPSAARYAGLMASKGKYVAFVDGDDYLDSDMIEQLMNPIIEDDSIDISIGGHVLDRIDGSIVNALSDGIKVTYYNYVEAMADMFEGKKFIWSLWGKIYKKELLLTYGIMSTCPSSHGDDTYVNSQVFPIAKKMVFVPVYGYHYCMRSDSMMHKAFNTSQIATVDVLNNLMEKYSNISNRVFNALGNEFMKLSIRYLKNMLDEPGQYHEYIAELQKKVSGWRHKLSLDVQQEYALERLLVEPHEYLEWKEHFLEKISDFCRADNHGTRVYIYGTGAYGKETFSLLLSNNIVFSGFIESIPKKKMVENYPIYSMSDIDDGAKVIIAMNYQNSLSVQRIVNEKNIDVLYIWKYFLVV